MKLENRTSRFWFPGVWIILVCMLTLPGGGLAAENDGVIETESGIYYTVKEGDTLWDLSRRFANSPWQWPDMWKDNRHIANPHEIYPGDRIRLYRRKDVERLLDTDALDTDDSLDGAPAPRPTYRYSGIDKVGFVRETPITPVGALYREHARKEMISAKNRVYIKPNGDARLAPGGLYTVYRIRGRVYSPVTGAYLGAQHVLLGVVEILQEEPRLYVARVTKSFRDMKNGDLLTPYRKRQEELLISRGPMGFSGAIVSPEEDIDLLAAHHIAFIDKGEKDGVRPGQMFYAYYEEASSPLVIQERMSGLAPPPLKNGEMIVLLTERTTATVLITQSNAKIERGSKIGVPEE
ncbi:MAG: LysM peptidoglycan-binding domain-containing protein [Desulfobacterales bacterium]|nr:LysM peptidoglycan-binding domain-containing protein [Desulfobacterales bacterium]